MFASEKRSLYTRFLRVAEDMRDAAEEMRMITVRMNESSASGAALRARIADMRMKIDASEGELRRLRSEVSILGGPAIGVLARELIATLISYATNEGERDAVAEALSTLVVAMHRDADPMQRKGN